MGKFSRPQIYDIFLTYYTKKGYDILCKLSPKETVCMKCQSLISSKNKRNISNCRLLKFLHSMLSVKDETYVTSFVLPATADGYLEILHVNT